MTTKEVEKIRKNYMRMVTSPQYNNPPKTKTWAMLSWLEISIAIKSAGVVQDAT